MILVKVEQDTPHHVTPIVENHVVHVNAKISYETPVYEGTYKVEPMIYKSTVLETKQKVMTEDVVIQKIEVRKVKNATGGYTLYVAESED